MAKTNEQKLEELRDKLDDAIDGFHDKQRASTRTRSLAATKRYTRQILNLIDEMYPPKTSQAEKAKRKRAAKRRYRNGNVTHVTCGGGLAPAVIVTEGVRCRKHHDGITILVPKWAAQAANVAELRRAKKDTGLRRALTAAYNLELKRGRTL